MRIIACVVVCLCLLSAIAFASPARYALIENGTVVNCIVYDPQGNWQPPAGATLIQSDVAQIGDTWDGTHFSYIDPTTGQPTVRN